MGAFYLCKNESTLNIQKAKDIFKRKGFKYVKILSFTEYHLLLFPKLVLKDQYYNLYLEGENLIFSFGTVLYKKYHYKNVIRNIYYDFINKNLDNTELSGHFCIFIWYNRKLYFFNDNNNNCKVYINTKTFIISSSFLAIADSFEGHLSINNISVITNIISGCQYGNLTYFNEIELLNKSKINHIYSELKTISFPLCKNINQKSSFKKSVHEQISTNLKSFNKIGSFIGKEHYVDIGLSGGFDSRLLLLLAHKTLPKLSLHSNYKSNPDKDLIISRKLANYLNNELKEIPVKSTTEMDAKELQENLWHTFLFYDGQFRVNHGWTRAYRTFKYRQAVLSGSLLGISGHNGEQFRNDFYLRPKKKTSLSTFLMYYLFNNRQKFIINPEERKKILLYWQEFFTKNLKLRNTDKLTLKDLRTFYTNFWVMAGPGFRCSAENQISYYTMPFMEHKSTCKAKEIIPHLGNFGKFQAEMIKQMDTNIAKLESNYGYNFFHISIKTKIIWYLRTVINIKLKSFYQNYFKNIVKPYVKITFNFSQLKKFNIPIDWKNLYQLDEDTRDRIIAFDFIVNYFQDKLKLK